MENRLEFKGIKEVRLFINFYWLMKKTRLNHAQNATSLNQIAAKLEGQKNSTMRSSSSFRFIQKLKAYHILVPAPKSTQSYPIYYVDEDALDDLFDTNSILMNMENIARDRTTIFVP